MASISPEKARTYGLCTVISAWLAVFCLFGYRSSFSIMQKMIIADTGWTTMQVSLGYCLMMTIYAITAFFSGSLVDKRGCRPTYAIGAVTCFLGFFLTSMVNVASPSGFYLYLFTYGVFAGVGTGMLWVSSTISCRKWYVGARYGTMWGLAFMGAPMAQLILTLVLKPVLNNMGWQVGMKVLAVIMAVFLIVASLIAKRTPDHYGVELTGKFSDNLVKRLGNERKGRKIMLIIGPACGAIGTILLLTRSVPLCIVSMIFLAIYWGIEPGGCAGYAGSVFGGATLGKIWGLATLIVMGIGPSFGTFMGAWFNDNFGSYIPALIFCLCAYLLSMVLACTLPMKVKGEQVES